MRDRIQLSRVANIFDSFEEAKNYLKSKKDVLRDGEGLLARYVDPNNKEIKTALGICYVDHPGFGQKNHVTVFMGDFDNLIMEMVHEYLEHAQIEGNGRITITQDGNTIGTFKVNDFNDTTIDLDLTSFISNTVNDLVNYYTKDETYTKEEVNSLIVTPNIGEGLLTINFNSTKAGEFNANQIQDATININETDPTVPAHVKSITQEDITNWNEGEANVIEHIKKNNVELTITDKTVNIEVPTNTSQLTNDSNFITLADVPDQAQADWNQVITTAPDYIKNKPTVPSNTSELNNDSGFITYNTESLLNYYRKSETYNKDEVNALIASIEHFHWEIYPTLQDIQDPQSNVLYLIGPTGAGPDKYEEYVYSNGTFVKIGETTIDLSNYYTKSETYNKTEVDTAINNAVKNGKLNITFNGVDKGDFYANQDNNTFVVLAEEDPTVPSHVKSITQQNINNWNAAQPNVIEEVQVNGTPLPVSNKSVNVTIPAPTPAVVVDNDATLDWNTRTDVGSVDGTSIHVTMPANPNTDTQADWNQADTTSPAYINNKPSIPAAQVNADWNAQSGVAEILNKPTNLSDFNNDVVNDNTITIKTNGTTVDSFTTNASQGKTINIPVPANTSDLNNDSGFITNLVNDLTNYYTKSQTYTQAEVDALIGGISSFTYEIYPSTSSVVNPQSNVLYLIGPDTSVQGDQYEEYVYTNNTWIKIGDTSIDLSGYAQTSSLANVAFSGNYSDLNGTPTVNDKKLTIKQGVATKGTFTANSASDVTITVDAPNNGALTIKNKIPVWRIPTVNEWKYLLQDRSGNKFAKCQVDRQYNCLIVFPDNYTTTLNNINNINVAYTVNALTSSDAELLTQDGCLILPAGGYIRRNSISDVDSVGHYYTSTAGYNNQTYAGFMFSTYLSIGSYPFKYDAASVRLMNDVEGIGPFTISGRAYYFASGNLQYHAVLNEWRFATNQWDYIGNDNTQRSASYNGWIDLFGYGCNGIDNGQVTFMPYDYNNDASKYWSGNLSGTKADWSYVWNENSGSKTYRFTANDSNNTTIEFANVSFTGEYSDLKNTPTVADVNPQLIYEGTDDTQGNITIPDISSVPPEESFIVLVHNCNPHDFYQVCSTDLVYDGHNINKISPSLGGYTPFYNGTVDTFELTLTPLYDNGTLYYAVTHFSYVISGGSCSCEEQCSVQWQYWNNTITGRFEDFVTQGTSMLAQAQRNETAILSLLP